MKPDNEFNKSDGVTLKEFLSDKIDALEDKTNLKIKLNQIALDKFEDKLEIRLHGMNEMRGVIKDQIASAVTKKEIDVMNEKISSDLKMLREFVAELKGKASMSSVYFSYFVAVIGVIIAIVGLLK